MKKMFRRFSAAAMSAALVLGNGVMFAANAEEEVTTTAEAVVTDATTEAVATTETVPVSETTATSVETTQPAETTTPTQGFVAGTFYSTSSAYQGYNTYNFASDGKSGSCTNSVTGSSVNFTASYANGVITVNYADGTSKTGNVSNLTGNTTINEFTITWNGGQVETFSATVPTITTTTATAIAASTTTSAATTVSGSTTGAASTTKAATTTAKPNKNDSPKTGDSFPALAMTAALLTAAGLTFATKKRSK